MLQAPFGAAAHAITRSALTELAQAQSSAERGSITTRALTNLVELDAQLDALLATNGPASRASAQQVAMILNAAAKMEHAPAGFSDAVVETLRSAKPDAAHAYCQLPQSAT